MPTSFHGFEIRGTIGSGGMSTVYKGEHATLGYPVAIKVLHPGLAGDTQFISRFEREARSASALRSINIASVIDFGRENETYFIIMEYIDGLDLARVCELLQDEQGRSQPFPAEIALLLLEEVAYGLRDAHAQGIIHRDIKPSNILLNTRGEVKIADFGLARGPRDATHLAGQDLTRPGMIIGTPSYMSPEQAAGREDVDHRSDIFSLGVMAYQLFSGEKPFQGTTSTEVQERIISQQPRALAETPCPLLVPEMNELVERMLAKDPGKRYQSMDQVLRGLRDCMESIDASGGLVKLRRDYLARFAKDPAATADELRHQAINAHLKLGFHYQNLGFNSIDDAMTEFRHVLRLDPNNQKASRAFNELKTKAEESGIQIQAPPPPARRSEGHTVVMPAPAAAEHPQAEAAPAPAAPARPASKRPERPPRKAEAGARPQLPPALLALASRWRLLAGAALVVVVGAVLWSLIGGRESAPRTAAMAVSSEPAAAQVWVRRPGAGEFQSTGQRTDCVVAGLQAGEWEVRLVLAGYVDTTLAVSAAARDTARVHGVLRPLPEVEIPDEGFGAPIVAEAARDTGPDAAAGRPDAAVPTAPPAQRPAAAPDRLGKLEVTTTPAGARLSARQGSDAWSAVPPRPGPLSLVPGSWEIKAELDGYEAATGKVDIAAGRTSKLALTLRRPAGAAPLPAAAPPVEPEAPPTGTLHVLADPPCVVFIDGRQQSRTTPCRLDVEAGSRLVEVRHEDYVVRAVYLTAPGRPRVRLEPAGSGVRQTQYRVQVVAGEEMRLDFELRRRGRS